MLPVLGRLIEADVSPEEGRDVWGVVLTCASTWKGVRFGFMRYTLLQALHFHFWFSGTWFQEKQLSVRQRLQKKYSSASQ